MRVPVTLIAADLHCQVILERFANLRTLLARNRLEFRLFILGQWFDKPGIDMAAFFPSIGQRATAQFNFRAAQAFRELP